MIFIVTALKCEAVPFIQKYSLKMIPSAGSFSIYGADDIKLVITGTGGPAALCAVTYLLASSDAAKEDVVINCGCSGLAAGDPGCKEKTFVIRSVRDEAFGRSFYPDMITDLSLPEADLITVTKIRTQPPTDPAREVPLLVDMEGAYVYQAASRFIYAHNIYMIKTVSDIGSDSILLRPEDIGRLMDTVASSPGRQIIDQERTVPKSHTLSFYQTSELKKLAENYALRRNDLDELMEGFNNTVFTSRREAKAAYAKLRAKLLMP